MTSEDEYLGICTACTTNQHCCTQLSELRLTKDEFKEQFKNHEEELLVRQSNKSFIVSPKEGRACPHCEKGVCRIYQDRPIDCRLYPYMMTRVYEKRNNVKIEFITSTICPEKDRMFKLLSETDAGALVMEFGKKVYGEDKTINAQFGEGRVSRLRNRIDGIEASIRFRLK